MKAFNSTSDAINFIETSTGLAAMPLATFFAALEARPALFPSNIVEGWNANKFAAADALMERYATSTIYDARAFAVDGVATVEALVTINVAERDGAKAVSVEGIRNVLKIGDRFFNVWPTHSRRYALTLIGATPNVKGREFEGKPNNFSKATAKHLAAWADWLAECEAVCVADVAAVEAERAEVIALLEESGMNYRRRGGGVTVTAGPMDIYADFGQGSISYRVEINRNVVGFGRDILAYALATFGRQPQAEEQPTSLTPTPKEEGRTAYRLFKRLATVEADGQTVWTPEALELMKRTASLSADDSRTAAARDICRRALSGVVSLTDKQRWLVAYVAARVA